MAIMKARGIIEIDRWDGARRGPGKRWQIRVWDGHRRRYRTRSFDRLEEGRRWARIEYGLANAASDDDHSGPLMLADVQEAWHADQRRRGRRDHYIRACRVILDDAVRYGLGDLRSRSILAQAERWLDEATTLHPNRNPQPISGAERNKRIRILRAAVHFAQARGDLDRDPLLGLRQTTLDRPLRATLSLEQCRALIPNASEPLGFGHAIALMLYAGLRLGEALHLRWQDVLWEERQIIVRLSPRLKRRRERSTPLQPELAELLRNRWRLTGRPTEGYLLPDWARSLTSKREGDLWRCELEHRGIWTRPRDERGRLAKTAQRCPWTPHSCRHTWVCLMLATGENAPLVQAYAGHEHLITTQGYARSQALYRSAVAHWPRGRICLLSDPGDGPGARRVVGDEVT